MNKTLEFLIRHGTAVLFVAVFVEEMGAPLPAAPWLLAAGALLVTGKMNWLMALGSAALGSILADLTWFYLGRHGGHRVLKLLCRISLEPDSCVRRTRELFNRYGMRGVVLAKFIPGLGTLVPPLAGSSGVSVIRFAFFDGVGSLLYVGTLMLVGVLFSHQLEQVIVAFSGLGRSALAVILGLAALYIGYKYFQRQRLLSELRMARITVEELRQKQMAGENPIILDLRSLVELEQQPALIPGAFHMTMDQVQLLHDEIPRNRDVILYCSCPNEVSSARMALFLHRKGVLRVRPLLGGIDAWREHNYPTELRAVGEARVLHFDKLLTTNPAD